MTDHTAIRPLWERDCVLFDLDGTLSDSFEGVANSVAYALEAFGIHDTDRAGMRRCIGPPLNVSFHDFYGMDEEQAWAATEKFRERYNVIGLYENTVYPGIPELLRGLRAAGRTLMVATGKPTPTAREVLRHFDILDLFTVVSGPEFDGTRGTKREQITWALEQAGITDPTRAVMVGDRHYDILGAKETGVAAVGVLYGFGSREELIAAGADCVAESVSHLRALLTGQ